MTTTTPAPAHERSGTIILTLESFDVNTDTLDNLTIDPTIAAAADHVARAEADLAAHQRVTQQAQEAESQLAERIAALDARRAAIGARRQDGDRREGDGAHLELIALDREGLAEMLAEAGLTRAEAQEREQKAAMAASTARQGLAHAEDQALIAALKINAEVLSGALMETLTAMADVGKRVGASSFRWTPSEDLMAKLRGAAIAGRPL